MPNVLETIELIESFSSLPKGWNFGSGEPSAPMPLELSKAVLYFAYNIGLVDFDAFPGTDGEIQLNLYKDDANIELMFEINGLVTVTFEEGDVYLRLARAASLKEVLKYLKEFQYNKCRTSVSSISQSTTSQEEGALQVPRLSLLATGAVYLWSAKNVERSTAEQSVRTFQNITRLPLAHQSSFGKSRTNKSPKIVHSCIA